VVRRVLLRHRVTAGLLALLLLPPVTVLASSDRDRPSPAFNLNRVRLYIVHAREGQPQITLPPLRGHHSNEVVLEAVTDAVETVQRVRRHYPWSNLEIVSQSHYLLQAVRTRGGRYVYRLIDEPGWSTYSTEDFTGQLSVVSEDGPLCLQVDVLQGRENVLHVQMQLEPGRPVALGRNLRDGSGLIAVLSVDTPDSSPAAAEPEKVGYPSAFGPDATGPEHGTGAAAGQIFLHWDTPPRLLEHRQPDYPDIARRAEVEGYVTMHVVVGLDGSVEEVQVADANPRRIFDAAALEAVRQWRYSPALINGRPVRALFSQTVQFVLNDEGLSIYR